MKVKKDATLHQRHFEVVESGEAWVHLRVQAAAKKAGYIWRYGITPTKDTPPTTFSPLLFTLEVDIILENMQTGEIYGAQYASVLPEHRPTFSDGVDPYQFSDFIYFVIQ